MFGVLFESVPVKPIKARDLQRIAHGTNPAMKSRSGPRPSMLLVFGHLLRALGRENGRFLFGHEFLFMGILFRRLERQVYAERVDYKTWADCRRKKKMDSRAARKAAALHSSCAVQAPQNLSDPHILVHLHRCSEAATRSPAAPPQRHPPTRPTRSAAPGWKGSDSGCLNSAGAVAFARCTGRWPCCQAVPSTAAPPRLSILSGTSPERLQRTRHPHGQPACRCRADRRRPATPAPR